MYFSVVIVNRNTGRRANFVADSFKYDKESCCLDIWRGNLGHSQIRIAYYEELSITTIVDEE